MIDLTAPLSNGAHHKIYLTTPAGARIGPPLARVGNFEYTSVVNAVGHFLVDLPHGFNRKLLAYHQRVYFWRKAPGGRWVIEQAGLIHTITTWADEHGNYHRRIEGGDLNWLLDGRVIAYAAGSSQAQQTDQADDMLKVLVRQNLGASATDTARALSSAVFSVAADDARGPSITKAMSYRGLLDTMVEIANAARQAGTEVYFGIVPTSETAFAFRTFIGQTGRDRTSDQPYGLTFSINRKNLYLPKLVEAAASEVNVVYAAGAATAEDTARSGRSLFGRREAFIWPGQAAGGNSDEAGAALKAGRPQQIFTAEFLSVPGSLYGKHWSFGDRVSVNFDRRQFDALVRARTIAVEGQSKERITALAEAYL